MRKSLKIKSKSKPKQRIRFLEAITEKKPVEKQEKFMQVVSEAVKAEI